MPTIVAQTEKKVFKKVLKNGLTILVRPNHIIPKVSVQLWYNVGSKDEKTGQKGIAHLIEHMIFKGTEKLSESDINMITYKLSGSCNAFTSYDYTGYLFDFPRHHWQESLPIMADCMSNCTFKQELLNSEMKAVIQELKMYRDNYPSSLVETMISAIFTEHPYHYPIIGFKEDLWDLKRDALLKFYKEHYVPNNATLVVVGDVDPEEVFSLAEKEFGSIPANPTYTKELYHFDPDFTTKSVTMYRDVQQPIVMLSFVIPGARAKIDYLLDALSWILGSGKGSRLQKKLIDELQLATEVETFVYDLFDYGLFFIYFQPKNQEDIESIIGIIEQEINAIITGGISQAELQRAAKKAQTEFLSVLENNQKQAYAIGQLYLATGDEQALFTYLEFPEFELEHQILDLLKAYFQPSAMNIGMVLPLSAEDKYRWHQLQTEADQKDTQILSAITREQLVEEGMHVHKIPIKKSEKFDFPKAKKYTLKNGLTVLYYHNPNVPMVDLILELKAKHYYDPVAQQGLNTFMSALLLEGTKHYNAIELAQAIESLGMTITASPGYLTMSALSHDLERGLSLMHDILTESTFEHNAIEKIRAQLIAELKTYWDTPSSFAGQLAQELVYKGHPYSKKSLGDFDTIGTITQKDLINFYKQYVSPYQATVALVGDLETYDIPALLEQTLGRWQGPVINDLKFPSLSPVEPTEIKYPISRDQVVLCYTGLSIPRNHPDFDNIILFDQIFTGGSLGSLSSRLFQLREQSGLFYTIGGSLLSHTDEQPGMVYLRTIVSLDRLKEAEEVIAHTIDTAAQKLFENELEEAKNALVNSLIDNFESNGRIASAFLFLERFKLPETYFDTRPQQLAKVKEEDVLTAARNILQTKKLAKIKVGRV